MHESIDLQLLTPVQVCFKNASYTCPSSIVDALRGRRCLWHPGIEAYGAIRAHKTISSLACTHAHISLHNIDSSHSQR
jgi:hypothetical protein